MNCHCNPGPCDSSCGRPCKQPCAYPTPFLGIEGVPNNIGVVRFNINGKRADFDYTNLVYQTQSDTTLVANIIDRLLTYTAERHTDTITASELGSILHLADLGDVSTDKAQTGSFLVYQKDSNCGEGCKGLQDTWKIWNALNEQVSSATYPAVFDANGAPQALERPANPNQYYQYGWNAQNGLGYTQIPIVDASRVVGTNGKKIALYQDPTTKQIVGVYE